MEHILILIVRFYWIVCTIFIKWWKEQFHLSVCMPVHKLTLPRTYNMLLVFLYNCARTLAFPVTYNMYIKYRINILYSYLFSEAFSNDIIVNLDLVTFRWYYCWDDIPQTLLISCMIFKENKMCLWWIMPLAGSPWIPGSRSQGDQYYCLWKCLTQVICFPEMNFVLCIDQKL